MTKLVIISQPDLKEYALRQIFYCMYNQSERFTKLGNNYQVHVATTPEELEKVKIVEGDRVLPYVYVGATRTINRAVFLNMLTLTQALVAAGLKECDFEMV